MASENRPLLGLNITKALIDGHGFNVAVAMLAGSGVVDELEADEGGAGITLFIPTDEAFADLPVTARFQSLPADQKAVVLFALISFGSFVVLFFYYIITFLTVTEISKIWLGLFITIINFLLVIEIPPFAFLLF